MLLYRSCDFALLSIPSEFFIPSCYCVQKKESTDIIEKQTAAIKAMEAEKERLLLANEEGSRASNKVTELEEEIRRLRKELEQERGEKQDVISEKELLKKKYDQVKSIGLLRQSLRLLLKLEFRLSICSVDMYGLQDRHMLAWY